MDDIDKKLTNVIGGKYRASKIKLREASTQYCIMPKKTRKARIRLFC